MGKPYSLKAVCILKRKIGRIRRRKKIIPFTDNLLVTEREREELFKLLPQEIKVVSEIKM